MASLKTTNEKHTKNTKHKRTMKKRKLVKYNYTQKDFHSNDGMLTTVWGPSMWHVLHTISFNYPVEPCPEVKKQYRDFVLSLKQVLPCGKCRANLTNNLKKMPLTMKVMKNRDTFSRYIYDLHEVVNKMLKKESGLSYDDVRERYENFRARCTVKLPVELVKETGCVEPLYGEKSKCILRIVPQSKKCDTFLMDEKCRKKIATS